MSSDLRIAIAGASGALGAEVLATLDRASWRPGEIIALAGATSTTHQVEYGDTVLPLDALDNLDYDAIDALIVLLPRGVASSVIARAASAGLPVVDTSGATLDDLNTPLVVPWVSDAALQAERERDVVGIPSAAGTLLASVLAPLADHLRVGKAEATVMLPASAWGHHGIQELSQQVVAMFQSTPAPRKVFPHGLAFDLMPAVDEIAGLGWSAAELRTAAEVGRMTRVPVDVSLVGVPVFSGVSATLRIELPENIDTNRIVEVLSDAGLVVENHTTLRTIPRPRRVEGEPTVHVGRIRRGAFAQALHVWASMDNVGVTATAVVSTLGLLLRQRGLLALPTQQRDSE